MGDPSRDGVTTEPPDSLDYQRLTEATDLTVRWDTEGSGTPAEIAKRVDLVAVQKMAIKRATETAGLYGAARPRTGEIVRQFVHVWAEGFMFGVVFAEQRNQTAFLGRLPDKNLLGATKSIIGSWPEGEERNQEWKQRVDPATLSHTAFVRSVQAVQILELDRPDAVRLRSAQAGQWQDGFSMGLLFAELGGHRGE